MDIVEEMRGFEIDHEPDGWPAVKMKQVSALCDEIDALRAELQKAREQEPVLRINAMGGAMQWNPNYKGDWHGQFYAAPVPAMPMQSAPLSDEEIQEIRNRAKLNDNRQIDPMSFARDIERAVLAKAMPIPKQEPAGAVPEQPKLAVWYGSMPESNGRENWTAILHKAGDEGFDIFTDGHTIDRSEYPDRVKYAADCVRWLIGELSEKPCILDYDAEKHSSYEAASPRITEQDAREIVTEFEDFADEGESAYEDSSWETFMDWKGRALLNKLNANAAEVPKPDERGPR